MNQIEMVRYFGVSRLFRTSCGAKSREKPAQERIEAWGCSCVLRDIVLLRCAGSDYGAGHDC